MYNLLLYLYIILNSLLYLYIGFTYSYQNIVNILIRIRKTLQAQSAVAAEYTDFISAEK